MIENGCYDDAHDCVDCITNLPSLRIGPPRVRTEVAAGGLGFVAWTINRAMTSP